MQVEVDLKKLESRVEGIEASLRDLQMQMAAVHANLKAYATHVDTHGGVVSEMIKNFDASLKKVHTDIAEIKRVTA